MRIVTLDAVAHRRRMNRTLDAGEIFVGMAGDTQRLRGRSDQLDAGDVFVDANLVAACASHRDCGMDELPLSLVRVTLSAFGRVGILIERYRMDPGERYAGPGK